jgi:hypothetical protein
MLFGEIWTGRHLKRLNKLFGIRAPQSRITLAQEIQPVVDIEDVDEQFERRILGDVRSFAFANLQAAVAAQFSGFELQPISSAALVVVEGIILFAPVAVNVNIQVHAAPQAGLIAQNYGALDVRQPFGGGDPVGATIGHCRLNGGSNAGGFAGTAFATVRIPANQPPIILPIQQVLIPPFCLSVGGTVVNLEVDGGFIWHEREADPLELKPL